MMRRGEQAPRAFQAPVDVHASADGQVYMFKRRTADSAVSSDDEELNVMELRPYHDQPHHRDSQLQVLEREVQEDDNLNKLALQYGCKVAEIKRLNNLMQEQDLFALKSIKIPVQKHSFLTEDVTEVNTAQDDLPHSSNAIFKTQGKSRAPPQVQEATDFLMEVDNDMERLIQNTNDRDEELLEISDRQERMGSRGRGGKGHGADWGINWWNAVIAMLLIGIVLPIFYIIYFKTRPTETSTPVNSLVTNSSGRVTQRPQQEQSNPG